jgi:hypothetical protein
MNTTVMGHIQDKTKDQFFDKKYSDSRKRQPNDIVHPDGFDQMKRERRDVGNGSKSLATAQFDVEHPLQNPLSIDQPTTKSENTSNLEPSPLTRQTQIHKTLQQKQPSPQGGGNLHQSYASNYPYNQAAYPHMAIPGYPPSGYMSYPTMHGIGFMVHQSGTYYPTMYNPYLLPHPQTQMHQENMMTKDNSEEETGNHKSETTTSDERIGSEKSVPLESLPTLVVAEKENVKEKNDPSNDVLPEATTHYQQNHSSQNNAYGALHHGIGFPAQSVMHPAMYMNPATSYIANRPYPVLSPAYGGAPFAPGAYGLPGSLPSAGSLNQLQPRRGIRLALACDAEQLSDYQILVRQQLEVFEAGSEDIESNTQGRKKPVVLGQVGLRCRHCAALPLRARGRGAVYYPAKLQGIYQAAQNMAGSHLCEACQQIPNSVRDEIRKLRDRRDNASGGKQYWADGCRALGIFETESGLKIAPTNK